MKDEEFQKGLERILKTFYDIEKEVKQYLVREKFYQTNQDQNSLYSDSKPILGYQYKPYKVATRK